MSTPFGSRVVDRDEDEVVGFDFAYRAIPLGVRSRQAR